MVVVLNVVGVLIGIVVVKMVSKDIIVFEFVMLGLVVVVLISVVVWNFFIWWKGLLSSFSYVLIFSMVGVGVVVGGWVIVIFKGVIKML